MAVQARTLDATAEVRSPRYRHGSLDLARRLPPLVVAARQIAASVAHGVHGRRRAGVGESFWQFRPFVSGESASFVDWRRSARDDRTYVREREWEAAQTVWIWIDRSPSMAFRSSLAPVSKLDRALTLGLAAADLLVRGGERVGLHGLTRPLATRAIIDRLAEVLVLDSRRASATDELPSPTALPTRSQGLLIGDFLADPADIEIRLAALAARGAAGHLVMVADPLEETFPFEGHVELQDSDTPVRLRLGEASRLRETYLDRLARHRAAVASIARTHGWTMLPHRTDTGAAPALLSLAMRLGAARGTV